MLTKIILELLENAALGGCIPLEIIAFAELFNRCFLFFRQRLGNVYADIYHQVAVAAAIALNGRQSFSAQTQRLAGLCTRFHFDLQFGAFNGGNLHLAT